MAMIGLASTLAAHEEHIGTVRQPLVGGGIVDQTNLEEFGLLTLLTGTGTCSASLLRNSWVVTAAHCVELNGGTSAQMPDPARPGQNVLNPIALIKLDANGKTFQEKRAVRVETFRPYDVAIIQTNSPFAVRGSATGFSRLIFQDGQFPYFGEPVGVNILAFGRGINVFASGSGNSQCRREAMANIAWPTSNQAAMKIELIGIPLADKRSREATVVGHHSPGYSAATLWLVCIPIRTPTTFPVNPLPVGPG